MIEEALKEQLYDKIPKNANIVIFGGGVVGQKIYRELKELRKDVKTLGFIDNRIEEPPELPAWTLKEFVDNVRDCDLVVFSTRNSTYPIYNILDVYGIPFLPQSEFVSNYYRNKLNSVYSDKNYNKICELLDRDEDKKLFDILFKYRAKITNGKNIWEYYTAKYNTEDIFHTERIKYHYLEGINKNAIKTLIDVGFHNGLNVIAFNKILPNLAAVYAFEAIYEKARVKYIEDFILNDNLKIIPYAIGEREGKISFAIDKTWSQASLSPDISSMNKDTEQCEHITVDLITLDKYIFDNNIKPDFIKMDIEGAETPALKGGMKCIQKYRPQLAISVYHSDEDFINILLYLAENLKDYKFRLGHYSGWWCETVLYAIPNELI